MIPTPIPAHVIATVFQYILPPSLPIPPHLLSRQLSERHRFLSISPTDIVSYLCWPSSEVPEIVSALEGTSHDTEPEYHIRYTVPDEETVLAHVRPTERSPLQVVFSWDGSWKYHDTRLWPFPSPSYESLQEALANMQMNGTRSSSPDSGDYWAGYGSGDDSPRKSSSVKIEDDEKAEAAYWASYSVVHGSGDSTVPSPRPEKQTQPEYSPTMRGPETAFDPFIANLHLRLQRENGRASGKSSLRSHSPRPENDIGVGEASVPEECSRNGDFPHISELTLLGESNAWICSANGCVKGLPEVLPETRHVDQLEEGLKESVKGLYQMWTTGFGNNDKEVFIRIVKDALE